MDGKPERIVDRRAVIRPGCRVERTEHEHRGERAQPDMGERFARKQRQIDIDNGRGTGVNTEPVCAGNPRAVEQRVDDDTVCICRRALDPETGEAREFLSFRFGNVDRETAGGEPVALAAGNRPKIARPLKDDEFVLIIRPIDGVMEPESGKFGERRQDRPDFGRRDVKRSSSIAARNTLAFSTTEMSMPCLYRNPGENSSIAKGDGDFLQIARSFRNLI